MVVCIFFYSFSYYLLGDIVIINYLKCFLWGLGLFIGLSVIVTVFNYFNVINGVFLKIVFLFIPLFSVFVGSFKLGKVSKSKGFIEGIKYGVIWSLLFVLIGLCMKSLGITSVVYFVILILVSVFGSILGINKKK